MLTKPVQSVSGVIRRDIDQNEVYISITNLSRVLSILLLVSCSVTTQENRGPLPLKT